MHHNYSLGHLKTEERALFLGNILDRGLGAAAEDCENAPGLEGAASGGKAGELMAWVEELERRTKMLWRDGSCGRTIA
jgi:hypothetical protein